MFAKIIICTGLIFSIKQDIIHLMTGSQPSQIGWPWPDDDDDCKACVDLLCCQRITPPLTMGHSCTNDSKNKGSHNAGGNRRSSSFLQKLTRFAWWWQDLHAIELLRAHVGEWTMTRMLDYWQVMCFTGYRLNWNPWIWIPFPIDSDCTLLCAQVDKTRYSSIASGNNCIVQLCKCVSLHL
jgi:hypothetical protein